jgi:hypothetical protein
METVPIQPEGDRLFERLATLGGNAPWPGAQDSNGDANPPGDFPVAPVGLPIGPSASAKPKQEILFDELVELRIEHADAELPPGAVVLGEGRGKWQLGQAGR